MIKVSALTYAAMCAAMIPGELTCKELAAETGLHYVTVLEYTRYLHRAGAVHIARWEPDARGRHTVKVYKLGAGQDAKRPRLTAAQRQERTRQKQRAAEHNAVLAGRGAYVKSANGRLRFEEVKA